MVIFNGGFATLTALLLFSITLISTQQVQFTDASTACVGYQSGVNTITITCDASFLDVVQAINDPEILEQEEEEEGQYILKANLDVTDGVTFEMNSNEDSLQYLKLAGENGIIVHGRILIDGVLITSWDTEEEDVIEQDMNGTVRRGYIQFAASEGSQILNSEFGYLGDVEPGRRGFDLFGEGPSHDMVIRNSTFHNMWFAFYSNSAYNITVDSSEYYDNIRYALDPHTVTHDMVITNNYLHDNPIGVICSDRCYNILIEGNLIEDTTDIGIFFSRNMTDSIARNNHVINARVGILVSESPNNQIYNNRIEEATGQGIRFLNPEIADDGVTEGNIAYDNAISDSQDGVAAARSQNNIVENTTFSEIESDEYHLSGSSSLTIRGQQFDETLISGEAIEPEDADEADDADDADDEQAIENNVVEIVGSGTIQVTGGADDGEDEGNGDDDDDEDGDNSYNTDIEPYTTILGDGDSITVNS
ncbi:MAG TPA: right-handed parallel beta-helix repeat-containing protein [Nitrososphaeraceae archaeon]|nr:right-handed parallel beta-helix repeat-containing protein [Nitrososphaeraceae archaeon]